MQLTFDTTETRQRNTADAYAHNPVDHSSARLKTGGPHKEPPAVPPLNRNPRKHDVVAWRNDGRLDTFRFDTKEAALEHGHALHWVVYYQWALMDGRAMLEKHAIEIPDGMALDDNGLPYRMKVWEVTE